MTGLCHTTIIQSRGIVVLATRVVVTGRTIGKRTVKVRKLAKLVVFVNLLYNYTGWLIKTRPLVVVKVR